MHTVLRLRVPRHRPSRPRTRVEAAPPYCLRVVVDERPVLHARIDPYWDRAWLVRTPRRLQVIPAIDAPTTRSLAAITAAGDDEGLARFFAELLTTSTASPLHEGDWLVSIARPVPRAQAWSYPFASMDGHAMLPPPVLSTSPASVSSWIEEHWSFGPDDEQTVQGGIDRLRRLDDDDDGRLKWWRKQARAGALPPVLVWFVPLLQRFVVLDGHVRLQAALDEGVTPTFCAVWSVRDVVSTSPHDPEKIIAAAAQMEARGVGSVDDRNKVVLRAWATPSPVSTLRAWPLASSTWRDEVAETSRAAKAPRSFIDELLFAAP